MSTSTPTPNIIRLPLYDSPIQAGFPSPADDHIELDLDLNEYFIDKPHSTYCARVMGNSMQGVNINPEDILIVNRTKPGSYLVNAPRTQVKVLYHSRDRTNGSIKMDTMPQLTESEKDIVFERAIHIAESMSNESETIQVVVPWRPKGIYVWVELQCVGGFWKRSRIIETLYAKL